MIDVLDMEACNGVIADFVEKVEVCSWAYVLYRKLDVNYKKTTTICVFVFVKRSIFY